MKGIRLIFRNHLVRVSHYLCAHQSKASLVSTYEVQSRGDPREYEARCSSLVEAAESGAKKSTG